MKTPAEITLATGGVLIVLAIVAKQRKFEEMYQRLFETQTRWGELQTQRGEQQTS